ncbi:MAG TPA: hypothetical protein VNG53_02385, partial [Bacteroidia bacterium]|nr:hypothetical protein [Bacteroidia bacterium]
LIHIDDKNHWSFKITARGIIAKPNDINRKGYFNNNYEKLTKIIMRLSIIPILYYLLEIGKIISSYFPHHPCRI